MIYVFHCLCHTNIMCDSKTDEHVKFIINLQCPTSDIELSNDFFQHYPVCPPIATLCWQHKIVNINLKYLLRKCHYSCTFQVFMFFIGSVFQTYCAITKIWRLYTCNVQSVTTNYRMISSNTIFTPSSFSANRDTLLTGQ